LLSGPDGEDDSFGLKPSHLAWHQSSIPENMIGDWYRNGNIELSVFEDSFQVKSISAQLVSVETSDPYVRIIYKIAEYYKSLYIQETNPDTLKIAYVDTFATSRTDAARLPVREVWYIVTSTNPWLSISMPQELNGNWHLHDGNSEINISPESFILDKESWSIEASQTNGRIYRLVINKGTSYKMLYYMVVAEYTMSACLVDGLVDLQDRHGGLAVEWETYNRWWDLLEKAGFEQDTRWSYDYNLKALSNEVINTHSPVDSFIRDETLTGRLELEVVSNSISGGEGVLTLQSTFQIDQEAGRYLHIKGDGETRQVVDDSSWVANGLTHSENFDIMLENDTLWFDTDKGKVMFASARLERHSLINLRPFAYPGIFNADDFPYDRDIFGVVTFSPDDKPQTRYFGDNLDIFQHTVNTYIISGCSELNYTLLTFGRGIEQVECFRGAYNNMDIWYNRGSRADPYVKEISFSCK